jgi:hypothetical protein
VVNAAKIPRPTADPTECIILPSANVRDLLTVEAKLITPVFSVEGPELVLFVHLNITTTGTCRSGHLLLLGGIEITTNRAGNLEVNLIHTGEMVI